VQREKQARDDPSAATNVASMIETSDGRTPKLTSVRPLQVADIILSAPVLPDDETADALIETVRHWRSEGGNV